MTAPAVVMRPLRLAPAPQPQARAGGRSAEHWQSVAYEAAAALALVAEADAMAQARTRTNRTRGVVEIDRVAWWWRTRAVHAARRLLDRLEMEDGLLLGPEAESTARPLRPPRGR